MCFLLHSRARMHLKKEQVPERRTPFPHLVPGVDEAGQEDNVIMKSILTSPLYWLCNALEKPRTSAVVRLPVRVSANEFPA
jgi:hypothetical protein